MPITSDQINASPNVNQLKNALAKAIHGLTENRLAGELIDTLDQFQDEDFNDYAGQFRRALEDAFNLSRPDALGEARRLILERLRASMEATPCIMAEEGRPKWFDPNLGVVDANQALGPQRWWTEYKRKLGQKVSPSALAKIEKDCLEIVNGALNRPDENNLLRKSLVVGRVQSGKTASMAGVIAMAADAGYNLFIVLSGTKENLRRQTNARLLKDLNCEGAGLVLKTLTNAEAPGWTFGAAGTFEHWFSQNLNGSGTRALGVVLKNGSRLRNLADALATFPPVRHPLVRCLVIDDEADEASVNGGFDPDVAAEDQDPTVINGAIRRIVHQSLPTRVAYLAYTATPFANVLQEPPNDNVPNLYPESFIHHLHQPSDYIGFKQIHGDPEMDGDGLNVISEIAEADAQGMRRGNLNVAPDSLKEALAWFIAASAERIYRSNERNEVWPHCSMLVHGAPKQAAHHQDAAMLNEMIETWKSNSDIAFDVLNSDAISDVAKMVSGTELISILPEYSDLVHLNLRNGPRGFAEMRNVIIEVLDRLEVVVDNAATPLEQRLAAFNNPQHNGDSKFQVICGGNTLSRGLTIEGLLCSYFYRRAGNMDALMQMGRWCGYRHGYEDLCRIWTTQGLRDTLAEAVQVESQLESQIAWMRQANRTPGDYGIRLRRNPGGIVLTSRMMAAENVTVDYTGECPQTILFENDLQVIQSNWTAGITLINSLPVQNGLVWQDVGAGFILKFLSDYTAHPDSAVFEGPWIKKFISQRLQGITFNVAVVQGGGSKIQFGNIELGSVIRSRIGEEGEAPAHLNIKTLRGPSDMLIDVDASLPLFGSVSDKIRYRMENELPPLLLLYPIDKDSQPRNNAKGRVPLQALGHLLGVSFIFGGDRAANNGVEVHMPVAPPEEEDAE